MFRITLQSKLMLYDSQYGCRKILSTELAAVELADRIRLYLDKGQIPL